MVKYLLTICCTWVCLYADPLPYQLDISNDISSFTFYPNVHVKGKVAHFKQNTYPYLYFSNGSLTLSAGFLDDLNTNDFLFNHTIIEQMVGIQWQIADNYIKALLLPNQTYLCSQIGRYTYLSLLNETILSKNKDIDGYTLSISSEYKLELFTLFGTLSYSQFDKNNFNNNDSIRTNVGISFPYSLAKLEHSASIQFINCDETFSFNNDHTFVNPFFKKLNAARFKKHSTYFKHESVYKKEHLEIFLNYFSLDKWSSVVVGLTYKYDDSAHLKAFIRTFDDDLHIVAKIIYRDIWRGL